MKLLGLDLQEWTVFLACRGRVGAGLFKGLRYVRGAAGSSLGPKLLGSYERELQGALARLLARPWRTVVNAGSGEGYYAVGIARACPGAQVVAFDIDATARSLTRSLARRNGIGDRLEVRGACAPAALCALGGSGTLGLLDVEGAEEELLDPAWGEGMLASTWVVEVHDEPGSSRVGDLLERRFAPTHAIERFTYGGRTRDDLPAWLRALGGAGALRMVEEGRRRGRLWLVMEPRPDRRRDPR